MITVYLDSQDYSALTDPRRQSPEVATIRTELINLSKSGHVKFVFSNIAICEAAPLTPESVHLAEMKADLLVELCGLNALVSFDRLVSMELKALLGHAKDPIQIITSDGTWFPDIGPSDEKDSVWQYIQQTAEADLRQQGLSRQQRRSAVRKLVKHGRPRTALLSHFEQQNSQQLAADLLEKYPMHPKHADTIAQYCLGRVSEQQFNQALIESLRDPRWMMRWFATNHSLANPIAETVRQPGRELAEVMRKLIAASMNHLEALSISYPEEKYPMGPNGTIAREWAGFQERQIINIARTLTLKWFGAEDLTATINDIEANCPGLTTTIRSIYSSAWDNVGGGRKELPSDSQPVDALHAMYAPYIDVFRADRQMAPHIQKQVNRHKTIVVARLPQLIKVIEQRLSSENS